MKKCVFEDCPNRAKYSNGWCQTHYHRWWRTGDPERVTPPKRKGAYEVGYRTVHTRVAEFFGKADQCACVKCGDRAREWAYDGTDPTEKSEMIAGRWPVKFSVHPEFYMPLCHPCHRLKDASARAARKVECIHGHPWIESNLYRPPNKPNAPECRMCRRERSARR